MILSDALRQNGRAAEAQQALSVAEQVAKATHLDDLFQASQQRARPAVPLQGDTAVQKVPVR